MLIPSHLEDEGISMFATVRICNTLKYRSVPLRHKGFRSFYVDISMSAGESDNFRRHLPIFRGGGTRRSLLLNGHREIDLKWPETLLKGVTNLAVANVYNFDSKGKGIKSLKKLRLPLFAKVILFYYRSKM